MLPRALLAELGLAKILLGSSGGGQFLLVLPEELREARGGVSGSRRARRSPRLSEGALKLLWSITENLGDWSDVRRRLERSRWTGAAGRRGFDGLAPVDAPSGPASQRLFRRSSSA